MDEDKKIFLERQWQLIDGNKKLRSQVVILICSLIIAISAFFFSHANMNLAATSKWLFATFVALLTLFGLLAFRLVHQQYTYSNDKIAFLYKKFEMDYLKDLSSDDRSDRSDRDKKDYEYARGLFALGYLAIFLIGLSAFLAIIFTKSGTV